MKVFIAVATVFLILYVQTSIQQNPYFFEKGFLDQINKRNAAIDFFKAAQHDPAVNRLLGDRKKRGFEYGDCCCPTCHSGCSCCCA